jgi:hypothetical protein
MNSLLANDQIKAKVQERCPDLEVSRSTIRDVRVSFGFKCRPPIIKQDRLPEQKFQYHQFGLDMLAENLTQRGGSFLMNADLFWEATRNNGAVDVVSEM